MYDISNKLLIVAPMTTIQCCPPPPPHSRQLLSDPHLKAYLLNTPPRLESATLPDKCGQANHGVHGKINFSSLKQLVKLHNAVTFQMLYCVIIFYEK